MPCVKVIPLIVVVVQINFLSISHTNLSIVVGRANYLFLLQRRCIALGVTCNPFLMITLVHIDVLLLLVVRVIRSLIRLKLIDMNRRHAAFLAVPSLSSFITPHRLFFNKDFKLEVLEFAVLFISLGYLYIDSFD